MFFGEGRIPIVQRMISPKPDRIAGRRSTSCCRFSARTLRRLQGDERPGRHDSNERSAAARVPAEARKADGRYRRLETAGKKGKELDESASCFTGSNSCRVQPDARHRRASVSASRIRKSPRCRPRSSRPPAALPKEGGKVIPRSIPLVGIVKSFGIRRPSSTAWPPKP